ncbi:Bardet-Biedl syndrome 10 protein [Chiloscyllium plagiosum]|uniref:Bardet-Biedl syndrome 10 protein n=1 Tax=Chiloscyllium plagiosum TaxID=36176 RepID=UPI001CB8127B|nr:Bardet-Biedl syndrome 10 protein [Chiloscyllium plagiosum]
MGPELPVLFPGAFSVGWLFEKRTIPLSDRTSFPPYLPPGRLMVQSVSAHCKRSGDGAKSFIVLLAAMLRGVRAENRGQGPACRRWLAKGLARLEQEVLGPVMGRQLAPHCVQALSSCDGRLQLRAGPVARVLEAYFAGKVGPTHTLLLTQLAWDYLGQLGGGQEERGLRLEADCFPGLLVTVPGLPVGSSRVLAGLPLSRGLALPCGQAQGPTLAVVVGTSLLPPLSQAGSTLRPEGLEGLSKARSWAQARLEETLSQLQALGVGLLLSGPRQPDCVLEQAWNHGLSVVHCLPDQELALLRRLSGAEAHHCLTGLRPVDMLPASFIRPNPLVPHSQLLLGFPGLQGCQLHCLLVCAPTLGLAQQLRDALHGAFTLLRLLLPGTATLQEGCEGQGTGEWEREGEGQGTEELGRESGRERRGTRGFGSQGQGTGDQEGQSDSQCTGECEIASERQGSGQWGKERQMTGHLMKDSKGNETGELGADKQGTAELLRTEEETKCTQATGEGQRCPAGGPGTGQSACQLPAGSVLRTGGTFELLVHHYLQRVSGSLLQLNTRLACRIVLDALLSIPRHLQPWVDRGRGCLQAQAHLAASLRGHTIPPEAEGPLEVVVAKQHLLISVLRCLRNLLTIDAIIPVHGKLRQNHRGDREDSD